MASGRYLRGPDASGIEAIGAMVATGYYQGLLPSHYDDMLEIRYGLRVQPQSPSFSHPIRAVTNLKRPMTSCVNSIPRVYRLVQQHSATFIAETEAATGDAPHAQGARLQATAEVVPRTSSPWSGIPIWRRRRCTSVTGT
jgi:hypothetical protein